MIPKEIKSILLFKLRFVGDVLLTTPAIRLLRHAYPKAHITIVVNRGTEEILRYNPHLDQVITIDRSKIKGVPWHHKLFAEWNLLKALNQRTYDIAIDFDSGERAAFLSLWTGTPVRMGFKYRKGWRRWLFTHEVEAVIPSHTVERNLHLLEQTLGLISSDVRLDLPIGPDENRRIQQWLYQNGLDGKSLIVIHPGARYWFKRWPVEKWSELIDLLQGELGYQVVITGGRKEVEDVQKLISAMKTPVRSLAGQTSVLELAALLNKATLFIGNDSGPAHIAAAVGTPVIVLFGPTDPRVWRPWGDDHLILSKQVECSPCKGTDCPMGKDNCMEQIKVAEVLQAVCQYLEKPFPSRTLTPRTLQ